MTKQELNKAWIVGILYASLAIGVAWDYSITSMHNDRASIIASLQNELNEARTAETLPPPTGI